MSSYDLKHKINARQEELRSTVIEAVRTLGNTTGENIPQLTIPQYSTFIQILNMHLTLVICSPEKMQNFY